MLRSIFFLGLSSLVLACSSSSSSGPSCAAYTTSIDLKTPTVSMKTDVQPILDRSCTFASCHGTGSGKMTLVQGDSSKSRMALVNVDAPEQPGTKIVAPGDPTNSWIMKKLDGDVCLFATKCTTIDGNCGDTMPQNGDLLSVDERDKFRRWIAQGANDN